MKNGKFHKEIGFPKNWEKLIPESIEELEFSYHALEQLEIRSIPQLSTLSIDTRNIFELVIHQEYIKFGYQFPIGNKKVTYIIRITSYECTVITTWKNHINDNHVTLDRTKYDTP